MAFTTIFITPGLPAADRRRARRVGPRAVATRTDEHRLLASAGFVDVGVLDVTDPFEATARRSVEECDRHADELAPLEEPGVFEQRQRDHRRMLVAIEDGLLRRAIFWAVRG